MKQLRTLLRSPWFVFGAGVFGVLCLIALIGPLLFDTDPMVRNGMPFEPPSSRYLMGTNSEGQDMLVQLVYGLRSSLYVGLLAGLIATVLGTTVGLAGGYTGGLVDNVLTMGTNLILVIPSLVILILISSSIEQRSLTLVALIIGLTTWTWTARAVRAQASSLRVRDHVSLARLNGEGTVELIVKQILPYILSYVFMAFILQMATGILSEAAISMLGLGPYETVSLGLILNHAQHNEALVNGNWWAFLPATGLVTLASFSLYVVNTSMESVFNPRLRRN